MRTANSNFKGRIEFKNIDSDEKILIENCDEIRNQYIANYQQYFAQLDELAKNNNVLINNIYCGKDILNQIMPIWQNALLLDEVKL